MAEQATTAAADTAATDQQQGQAAAQPLPAQQRTFTEEERDAYVKMRIDKQNAKHAGEIAERDARIDELSKASAALKEELDGMKRDAQLREWARAASEQTGVDASVLRGGTLEEMVAHGNAIRAAVRGGYPSVPGGAGQGKGAPLSKEEILAIKDGRERRAMIAANLDLFE